MKYGRKSVKMEKYFIILILVLVISSKSNANNDITNFCKPGVFNTELICDNFSLGYNEIFEINNQLYPPEKIHKMFFRNCDMTKITENSFNMFPKMLFLHIQNCNVKYINYISGLISTLQILELKNNQIEELPQLIGHSSLILIDLSGNKIKKIEENTFTKNDYSSKLSKISLRNNEITEIHKDAFKFNGLVTLDLKENNIENIKDLHFPTRLRHLYLNKNKIKEIGNKVFNNLNKLKELDLSDNFIEHLPEQFIQIGNSFPNFYLNLNNNKIKSLNENVFSRISPSLSLDLLSNQLTKFSIFLNSTKPIKLINLSGNNNIKNIQLKGFKGIKTLILRNTSITDIKSLSFLMNSIDNLDLSENPIGDKIQELQSETLKSLKLSSVNLKNINIYTFYNLKKLQILDLSNNDLNKFDPHLISTLNSLKTLLLDENNLTEIDYKDLKLILPNLKDIGLTRNKWNCEYLQQMINYINKKQIKFIIPYNHKYIGDKKIGGIGCYNIVENNKSIDEESESDSKNDDEINSNVIASLLETNKEILKYVKLNYEILLVLGRERK